MPYVDATKGVPRSLKSIDERIGPESLFSLSLPHDEINGSPTHLSSVIYILYRGHLFRMCSTRGEDRSVLNDANEIVACAYLVY